MRVRRCLALVALAVGAAVPAAQAAPAAYVTNARSASVSQYDAAGGPLTPLSPATVDVGNNPLGVAVSPDGANAYVTIPEPGALLQFRIGPTGTLTFASSAAVPPGALPGDLAVSPDGRSVYVVNSGGPQTLLQYTVAADGSLTPKSPPTVPTGPGPTRLVVSPDSRSVYVTNTVTALSTVSQYSAAADGTLTPKSPPTVPAGDTPFAQPTGIAISPDGQSVYVAKFEGEPALPGELLQYTVGAGGTLSPKSPPSVPAATSPFEVIVSPDGTSVYATNQEASGAVLQFDVALGGELTPKPAGAVPAGTFPAGLAISADGQSVYVANSGDNSVSQYTVGAGGALSPLSPPSVPAGINPLQVAVTPVPAGPTTKEQCKNGGWRQFGFKNQGQCIKAVKP